jgi:nitric oxide synthase oxygenase domain/subunit
MTQPLTNNEQVIKTEVFARGTYTHTEEELTHGIYYMTYNNNSY